MPAPIELNTADNCLEHLRGVLACLDRMAARQESSTEGSLALAAIYVQQAIDLIEHLQAA